MKSPTRSRASDMDALADELGDLQLQVVFHAHMAEEAGLFTLDDVIAASATRWSAAIRTSSAMPSMAAITGWETIKAEERAGNPDKSALAGVALALPALERAEKLQRRAARVGFDWPDASGPRAKIDEELAELDAETEHDRKLEELGDLLFAVVNLARHLNVEPETALREANRKFERRFRAIEKTPGFAELVARREGSALGARQEGSGRLQRLKPRPIVGRQAHRQLQLRHRSSRWSSTSPRACSQAIRSPSPAGNRIWCDLLPAAQPFGHALAQSVDPLAGQRRDRHDVLAPRGLLEQPLALLAGEQVDLVPRLDPRRRALFRQRRAPSARRSTSSRCASLSGWAMSRTWTMRSADTTSSSVARKAATSWVGRSEMKPTVSDRIALSKPGSRISRIVGSSVANSRFSANTLRPVSRLNRVDLPALV